MSNRGRKSKYETHVKPEIKRIPKWRKQGMTEEQICKKLGVGVSTFNRYKNEFRELREAIKEGREELIENLEESLYKRALGYEYEETKKIITQTGEGKHAKRKTRIETTKKHVVPDTGAIAFSLKNLAPEKWKDKHEVEHSGGINHEHKQEIEHKLQQDPESQELVRELYRRTAAMDAGNSKG